MLRVAIASISLSVLCVGCASSELRGSTLAVSTSIGPIIEQQVLGNLAQSYDSPYSIPAQAVLSQGAIQIQNQATASLKLPYTHTFNSSKEADPGVTFQWQETWTIVPVMDSEDLDRLQYLYSGATMPLRKAPGKPLGHYLSFSIAKPKYGEFAGSCDTSATSPAPKPGSPPPSPFQNCAEINKLLSEAPNWLSFDSEPVRVGDASDPNNFTPKGKFGRHHIWVRPREFAKFTMYVLYATPNSQDTATNAKGLSFSIQERDHGHRGMP
ncbi:MAG: hypothetical protein JWP44_4167 [Mucilaginibacter sp.]|nr:hypothetical protein [Mucilaginibacter sp.]